MTLKGTLFVVAQFSAIAILLKYINFDLFSVGTLVQFFAILVGLSAIWAIRRSKLSVFPELKHGANLVQTGPYKIVRHPMYSAVLLFCLPAVFSGIVPLFVYFVLLATLILKMRYEEQILNKEFAQYKEYSANTFFIMPYIY